MGQTQQLMLAQPGHHQVLQTVKQQQQPSYTQTFAIQKVQYYTVKKMKENFPHICIRKFRSGAKHTYMGKGFLIYEEMRKYLVIYEKAVSHV